jgi:hypothetical protein
MKWTNKPSKFTFESKIGNFVRIVDRFEELLGRFPIRVLGKQGDGSYRGQSEVLPILCKEICPQKFLIAREE